MSQRGIIRVTMHLVLLLGTFGILHGNFQCRFDVIHAEPAVVNSWPGGGTLRDIFFVRDDGDSSG